MLWVRFPHLWQRQELPGLLQQEVNLMQKQWHWCHQEWMWNVQITMYNQSPGWPQKLLCCVVIHLLVHGCSESRFPKPPDATACSGWLISSGKGGPATENGFVSLGIRSFQSYIELQFRWNVILDLQQFNAIVSQYISVRLTENLFHQSNVRLPAWGCISKATASHVDPRTSPTFEICAIA